MLNCFSIAGSATASAVKSLATMNTATPIATSARIVLRSSGACEPSAVAVVVDAATLRLTITTLADVQAPPGREDDRLRCGRLAYAGAMADSAVTSATLEYEPPEVPPPKNPAGS